MPLQYAPLVMLAGIAVGFIIGKYHERWNWNTLIQNGKISKPSNNNQKQN